MNNPFEVKEVPQSTQNEISKRSTAAGIQWAAKKFPWIHVTSMCKECPSSYVTLSSLKGESLYENNYKRPLPGVTQVDVKKLGELGTTRRATITILAFTDEQLINLQQCYFIPGMGCRVEWGWSQDASGNPPPSPLGSRTYTDPEAICKMNSLTKKHAHYNGIQGIVSNFSYELSSENIWNCTVEVISAAEAVGGTKLNEHTCNCAREYTGKGENGEEKAVAVDSQLVTFLKDLHDSFDEAVNTYSSALAQVAAQDNKDISIAQYIYNGPSRNEQGVEDTGFWNWLTHLLPGTEQVIESYISWSTLEAAITKFILPANSGKYTLGRIASPKCELAYHPYVDSIDPRVCLLPGSYYYNSENKIAKLYKGIPPGNAVQDEKVYLDHIMLNTIMLMQEAKSIDQSGDGTIATFMMNVLRRVNDACGNLWEFVITSNDDCNNKNIQPRISIAETKGANLAKKSFEIPANAIGEKLSVLRDISLKLKLTDSMKTQALYSNSSTTAKAKSDGGGSCGPNSFKPFGLAGKGVFTNLSTQKASHGSLPGFNEIVRVPYSQADVTFNEIVRGTFQPQPKACLCEEVQTNNPVEVPTFEDVVDKLIESVNNENVSSAKSELIKIYGESVDNDETQCVNMLLPFEFSFTLDGIGGFVFGQIVTCSRIPKQIRDSYVFQVTAVEHSVTSNDWTTTVNTIARYNPKTSGKQKTMRARQPSATSTVAMPITNESGIVIRPDAGKI